MQIREATLQDYAAICALFEQVDALHAAARPDIYAPPVRPVRSTAFVERLVDSESDALLVATSDEGVLGLVWVIARSSPPLPLFVPRRFAVVETLVVDEKARHQGVGRALMERAERWASDRGLLEVQLSVHEFNSAAAAFYAQLGYETVERRLRRRLSTQDSARR